MGQKVFVAGVGMTKFEKPGARDWDYPQMAKEAAGAALVDAGLDYALVEQVCVGYCYGSSTCGQRAVYEVGLSGVPIYNVNNNCSTGSTALFLAKQLVEGGLADCVLALGFEKMAKGPLAPKPADRTNPIGKHLELMTTLCGFGDAPPAAQLFGNAGREHMDRFGTRAEQFAKIGYKNHKHSVNNPNSQFQDEYTLDDIRDAKMIYEPLTRLQCCPTSDGAAAAIVCNQRFVDSQRLAGKAVEILGMAMATDRRGTFTDESMIKVVGSDMSRQAARQAYEQSGKGPEDVDVIELHDCFSVNELLTYEALELCPEGKGGELVDSQATTYRGRWVVNPSGGLISKGHPLGATGLAQCCELVWQLRGTAGKRQVADAEVALQHNLGLGGAAVVAIYGGIPASRERQPPETTSPR